MTRQRVLALILASILLVLCWLPIAGCAKAILSDEDLKTAYLHAIDDARIAEPDEIYRDLEAIVYYNPDLVWEGQPGKSRVLLLTWTSWDGYNKETGKNTTLSREVWVVVPGELKEFYRENDSLTGDSLVLRLEQLNGLPPHNGKQFFVEIWADPADVFRPSPDPDTADREAELDFPGWVDAAHRDWFNELKSVSYSENGYPWTRLGYTYDWGNEKSEIGLSEFVIKAGSGVGINTVAGTQDYFKN
jgi:hypothetical protein